MKNFFENFFNSGNDVKIADASSAVTSNPDLDNLDNLTDEQINELYDDVYIDSFKDPTIAYRQQACNPLTCPYVN